MPKTLSTQDANLVKAVERNARSLNLWGVLLIAAGAVTQFAVWDSHPVAGFPLMAIGAACLIWKDPALFAAVGTIVAFSIPASLNARVSLLGPDPLAQLTDLNAIERVAIALGKVLIALTAGNQFLMFRLLYGTARATSDDANLPLIPAMVPNRTDRIARWARTLGIAGGIAALLGWLLLAVDPAAFLTRVAAELGGSLGAVAAGLGGGAAFSPTEEREAALFGVSLGLVAFVAAAILLGGLP